MADLQKRVDDLEEAVMALAADDTTEFIGDLPGHPFRGNQHTGGLSDSEISAKLQPWVKGSGTSIKGFRALAAHHGAYGDRGEALAQHAYAEHKAIRAQREADRPAKLSERLRQMRDEHQVAARTPGELSRAQKLANYETMHGTKAMLDKMTPAEREAHIRSGAGARPVDLSQSQPPRPGSATTDAGVTPEAVRARLAGFGLSTEELGDNEGHPFRGNQWTTETVAGGDVKAGDYITNPNTGNPHEVVKVDRPSRSRKDDPAGQWSMLHVRDGEQVRQVEVHNGDLLDRVHPKYLLDGEPYRGTVVSERNTGAPMDTYGNDLEEVEHPEKKRG